MNFVEEFDRLRAQMHDSEARLEELLKPQQEKIAVLQKEKMNEKLKKPKERGDLKEKQKILNEIEMKLAELVTVQEEKRKKSYRDIDWSIGRVVKEAETDPYLIGKAMAICEVIAFQLICSVCDKICTEDNPIVACPPNNGDLLSLKRTCLKCSEIKEGKIDQESVKKIKELRLIRRIVSRLKGLFVIRK